MRRALLVVATLAACRGRDPTTAPTPPAPADAAAAAAPPDTFAIAGGAWTLAPAGDSTTTADGLAIVGDQVVTLLATIGGDTTLAGPGGGAGSAGSREVIAHGTAFRAVAAGQLATRGGQPVMLLLEADGQAMTVDVVYQERGRREAIATGCGLGEITMARLLATEPAPIVTYACGGDRIVARRDAAGWTTLATLDRVLATGAIDAAGDVVLVSTASVEPGRSWIVRGGRVIAAQVPGVDHAGELAACGGLVYGTFELPYAAHSAPAFGRRIDGAWQLETITTEIAGSGVLGFDEACHPFVALGDQVWSRARAGWVATSLGSSVSIRALVGHHGTLYASYSYLADGIRAGVASAAIRAD